MAMNMEYFLFIFISTASVVERAKPSPAELTTTQKLRVQFLAW